MYRRVAPDDINYFVSNLQRLSQSKNGVLSMWETQLQITYKDYDLSCEQSRSLSQQVTTLLENIKPDTLQELQGTQQQSLSEEWFRERWLRVTASKCHPAFKVGRLVMESLPNAAIEAFKSQIEIKALKFLKEYSVANVVSPTSPVPKQVLKRQCFEIKDGKCVLKRSHGYYYQCQELLLVTERKYCDFILYAERGPDSVERISRDEPLITKMLDYIQALWMRVIAPEIFEMRVSRGLLPFILPASAETSFPESTASTVDPCEPLEPSTVGPTDNPCEAKAPTSPPVSAVDFSEPEEPASSPSPHLSASTVEPVNLFTANASAVKSLYAHDEIEAAEALLHSFFSSCGKESPEQELTVFTWGGMTNTGINLNNTCPLDNWLMIFQALVNSGKVNLANLTESGRIISIEAY
ncbi:hypothetical protein AWC38_SpisGene16536 [Stylophora pistillata]|uniref:Uncharacterized protein n=1 Tax=Stylophora pistillata TaxID=50429 RepID=A0A2B4RNA1_STYPI|nr:hypothetical protein AWC38_SpisGene16536 [Stylophora pistillata]